MADETEAAGPEATVPEAAAAEPAATSEQPERDWDTLLNEAPADIISKHRRVQGIAGSHAERLFQQRRQVDEAERTATAREKAHEELRKMAQDKPLEFADMYLSHDDAEQGRRRILEVERNTAKRMMSQIGDAYKDLPEWQDLTDDEKSRLRQAVEGAKDEEVLPKFNKAALDIVADRRSQKTLADRLAEEKTAWRKEWEAERLASEQGPDLRRPSSTKRQRVDWRAMDYETFDSWWRRKYR